ncbi:MAG TPA: S8 family serine peptidase, partial [Planctomycetota bacterium]|nr:S8 family serine peptidase [Planctomycetota bacterium]
AAQDPTNLIVKFVEGSGVRWRDGQFVGVPGVNLAEVNALMLRHTTSVSRLFLRSEADLDRERAEVIAKLGPAVLAEIDPPADLNLYYRARTATAEHGMALWRALLALPVVETAFLDTPPGYQADPVVEVDDIPPTTPDYSGQQTYFDAPPSGINLRVARVIPGGRGEQLQICDIETGLILNHEDVPLAIAANVIGPNPTPTDHGLAVAGEMVADKNGYGVSGGVYRSRYKFHSHQSINWASSVNTAAANSQPGDIIVLEVQLPCPAGGNVCPMEGRQDVFDAVRNATMAGKYVIAAAGNGSRDLDNPIYNNAFNRAVRDSGSIIVGATDGANLVRASFSNYGSIVDANGWGQNVTTTGYGDLFYPQGDARQKYTRTFSGTSSATPIVTSAAAATLSAARQQLGRTISIAELRTLLRTHGTDVPNGSIGKRPDLAGIFAAIGLPNGLTVRTEANIGQTLDLDITGNPGESYLLALAADPAEIDLPFGRLLLDPATLTVAAAGTVNAQFSMQVPNNPGLLLLEVHWQALRFSGTSMRFTNSVVSYFER